jgi:hypothetical protein
MNVINLFPTAAVRTLLGLALPLDFHCGLVPTITSHQYVEVFRF